MSCNNHRPHLHIYSEDAATHDMADGFVHQACHGALPRQIQILPCNSGWRGVVEALKANGRLGAYSQRRVLCVIDLDNCDGTRIAQIRHELAAVYKESEMDRIYIFGCATEVESAKQELNFAGHNDAFGRELANLSSPVWAGDAVKHAKSEIERLLNDLTLLKICTYVCAEGAPQKS